MISSIFGLILPTINDTLGTDFESFSQVISIAKDLATGNYSTALAGLTPTLTNIFGEEYQPLFEELSSGKYEDMLHQIKGKQYGSVLSDLKSGAYPDLVNKLDTESYNYVLSELEKKANGTDSVFFDQIEELLP